jgi:hypothetical protein
MKSNTKIILGSAVALILGFSIAAPILLAYYRPSTSVQIKVDLVYAYLGVQQFNQNVTGLWINSSDKMQAPLSIISFFIVLNVTNQSNKTAYLTGFQVVVGPNVFLFNVTEYPSGRNSTGISAENPVVWWYLGENRVGWYPVWEPRQSRLIAVTGSVGTRGTDSISALANEYMYLYGSAAARPYEGGIGSYAYSFKYVRLQAFGTEFLYNSVLSNNQRWSLDHNGIDVSIVTIS